MGKINMSENKNNPSPIIISGFPRSGTTWIGDVVSKSKGVQYFFEPDNEKTHPLAWDGKKRIHRFPYLGPCDEAPEYEAMWKNIFYGKSPSAKVGKSVRFLYSLLGSAMETHIAEKTGLQYCDENFLRVSRNSKYSEFHAAFAQLLLGAMNGLSFANKGENTRVIKSVHSLLALDWLSAKFPVRTVVVLRNPHALFASYQRMKMPDGFRNPLIQGSLSSLVEGMLPSEIHDIFSDWDDAQAFQIALLMKVAELQIKKNKDWIIVSHDTFCLDPRSSFEQLFAQLGLIWDDNVESYLESLNKTGDGFKPVRVASQQANKWRSELNKNQEHSIDKWLDVFEVDYSRIVS